PHLSCPLSPFKRWPSSSLHLPLVPSSSLLSSWRISPTSFFRVQCSRWRDVTCRRLRDVPVVFYAVSRPRSPPMHAAVLFLLCLSSLSLRYGTATSNCDCSSAPLTTICPLTPPSSCVFHYVLAGRTQLGLFNLIAVSPSPTRIGKGKAKVVVPPSTSKGKGKATASPSKSSSSKPTASQSSPSKSSPAKSSSPSKSSPAKSSPAKSSKSKAKPGSSKNLLAFGFTKAPPQTDP
ncbi:hypothetical protein R3P38DRAFT_3569568, partial [Favolaschia claudopus]